MQEASAVSTPVRLVSWLGIALSLLAFLGLIMAVLLVYQLKFGDADQATGLTFLLVTSWLLLLGAGTCLFGGLGLYLSRGDALIGRRSRRSLIIGIVALAVGGLFGVNPFS